jgi:hypothetical protein
MAKEKTTEETTETKAEEKTETSTPDNSLTQPPGDTGDMLKAPHEEEKEANADANKDLGSLFEGETKLSEEELTGTDSEKEAEEKSKAEEKEKEEAAAAKSKDEEKKVEEEAKAKADLEAKTEKEEVKAKEEAEAKEKKDEKPPKGFVSKQALKDERKVTKALRDEIDALKTAPAVPRETKADTKWKTFKVLSSGEFNDLVEEDPSEAMKYSHQLTQFKEYKSEKDAEKVKAREDTAHHDEVVNDWTDKINTAIPGVYEEDSEVAAGLADTARELGFDDENYLSIMTDPRTLVIPDGQKETFFLGPGVMGLLKVLSNAKEKISSGVNEKDLREKIEKELTPEITAKVTKELTEKLKESEGKTFRSITGVPGGGDEIKAGDIQIKNEEDWARFKKKHPEQAEEMLRGIKT